MKRFLLVLFLASFVLAFSLLKKEAAGKPEVYDCFLFFNEFDLLKIRLTEMEPYVDHFVVVEAEETFRGDPKPLYFEQNKELFEKWKNKIIHVAVSGHVEVKKPMHRERFQRNQIMRGLKNCKNNDIVLISDVDEIVRRAEIPRIAQALSNGEAHTVLCQQRMYTYYLNRYQSVWPGTVATTFKDLKKRYDSRPTLVRHRRSKDKPLILANSGWHFSYMGGAEQLLKKVAAFSHPECDTPQMREMLIASFRSKLPCEKIDASFPEYVQNHKEDLEKLGLVDIP